MLACGLQRGAPPPPNLRGPSPAPAPHVSPLPHASSAPWPTPGNTPEPPVPSPSSQCSAVSYLELGELLHLPEPGTSGRMRSRCRASHLQGLMAPAGGGGPHRGQGRRGWAGARHPTGAAACSSPCPLCRALRAPTSESSPASNGRTRLGQAFSGWLGSGGQQAQRDVQA